MSFFVYCKRGDVGVAAETRIDNSQLDSLQMPPRGDAPAPPATRESRAPGSKKEAPLASVMSEIWDPLKVYLREATVYPLLSREEERAVARQVVQGDPEARERMILSNLRLVLKLAKEFEGYGLPQLDIINLGNVGLMKAVDRFDPEQGAKFSTYAVWWIRQGIFRGLTTLSRTIRLPAHKVQQIARLKRTANELESTLGREVTFSEIAEEAELSTGEVRRLLSNSTGTVPLDAPLGHHTEDTVGSTIADDEAKMPSAVSAHKDLLRLAHLYLTKLGDRERVILQRRFGLKGSKAETLEEIGADYGVTRERIRQIEAKALKNLRKMIEAGGKSRRKLAEELG